MGKALQIAVLALMLTNILSCGSRKSAIAPPEDTVSLTASDSGQKCINALYADGTIAPNQGFAVYSDGQETDTINAAHPETLSITASAFKDLCQKHGIELTP